MQSICRNCSKTYITETTEELKDCPKCQKENIEHEQS